MGVFFLFWGWFFFLVVVMNLSAVFILIFSLPVPGFWGMARGGKLILLHLLCHRQAEKPSPPQICQAVAVLAGQCLEGSAEAVLRGALAAGVLSSPPGLPELCVRAGSCTPAGRSSSRPITRCAPSCPGMTWDGRAAPCSRALPPKPLQLQEQEGLTLNLGAFPALPRCVCFISMNS